MNNPPDETLNHKKSFLSYFSTFNKKHLKIIGVIIFVVVVCTIGILYFLHTTNKLSVTPQVTLISQETTKSSGIAEPLPTKPSMPPCFQDGESIYQRGIPNNKFGMYMVVDPSTMSVERQMKEIASIVNSNGGDWGYVMLPRNTFTREAKDKKVWDKFFSLSHQYHLIPMIQLVAPSFSYDTLIADLQDAANFYNTYDWPSSCRVIVVYNETNARDFWGGDINPELYAQVLDQAVTIFKKVNPNYFILNGGFNASSRTGPNYLDEETYLIRMNNKVPGIFSRLDGWASHPYPQPEFSGDYHNPPSWYGVRDQIKSYEWELGLLKKHFNVEGLPVFFTETGWAHKEGNQPKWQYKPASVTATYFKDAFENVWLPDSRVVAFTPFIFNLGSFSNFNWMNDDGYCYPQCDVVKSIPKTAGTPNK